MKRLLYILFALLAVSCTKKAGISAENAAGSLHFDGFALEVVGDAHYSGKLGVAETRSAETHELEITITDIATGKVAAFYASHLNMPLTTVLPVGQYKVTTITAAKNRPLQGVGFDMPLYGAEETVEILPAKITTITVTCTQISCGVTVAYSDLFKTVFTDPAAYHTKVFSSHGHSIDFTSAEARVAHFEVNSEDMQLYYVVYMNKNGVELSDTTLLTTAAKRQTDYAVTVGL